MTKKLCCILFILMIFGSLSGCDEKIKQNDMIITDFTADFTAEYRQMSVKGSVTSTRQGVMNMHITSPETVSGAEITYKDSQILVSLGSLECSADEAYLPGKSFPQLFYSVMRGIAEGRQVLSSENENEKIYNMKISVGNAVINVNSENFICKIEIKEENLKITFSAASQL